jgi:hypothetical protein
LLSHGTPIPNARIFSTAYQISAASDFVTQWY